ncbi:MAG TPA: TonB-dependent receptor [Bacteroidota bacterium]|nr:TonB-dependent receptor [Bacteroidota bacterium]
MLTLALLSSSGSSQVKPDTTKTFYLDPITVTATNVEALNSRVPNAVSLISKTELAESAESSVLRVISERVPGVFVTERGVLGYGVSNGAAGGISIRGSGGSPNTEVLVLTDGRPQMMGLMGHPLPDTYVNSGIERVEIIRGPASLMHGTNAMGGVINIIREKPPTDGLAASLGISDGSFNTQKYEGELGYGTDHEGFSFDASHFETDGQREYSLFRENNGAVRGWTMLDEHYSLHADGNVSSYKAYDPGTVFTPAVNNWYDIVRGSSGVSVEDRYGESQGALKVFYNWGVHDIYDGFHSTDNNVGALLYQGFPLFSGNLTTAGIDYKRYGGTATQGSTDFGEHFINETAAYILTQQDVWSTATVSAGVRLNHHSLYGNETVPQIGVAYRVDDATTIKASAGKGFRSPTIRELYLFPAPTPTLMPERMWDYEVSVLHAFPDNVATIEATAFLNEGTNQIRLLGNYPNFTYSNSGAFTHRGVELSGSIRPIGNLDFDVTYSYLDPGDQTAANPKNKLYVGGKFGVSPLTFSLGLQHVSGLYGDDNHKEPLSEYTLLDVRVMGRITNALSAYVSVENLLGRDYSIMYGYPMPGRTIFCGLRYAAL